MSHLLIRNLNPNAHSLTHQKAQLLPNYSGLPGLFSLSIPRRCSEMLRSCSYHPRNSYSCSIASIIVNIKCQELHALRVHFYHFNWHIHFIMILQSFIPVAKQLENSQENGKADICDLNKRPLFVRPLGYLLVNSAGKISRRS